MVLSLAKLKRPYPPAELLEADDAGDFVPCQDVERWSMDIFVIEGARLQIPELSHLSMASIGFLWTNIKCERQMRSVVGMAKMCRPNPMQDTWAKEMQKNQWRSWFNYIPDFLITLYAPYAAQCDNASFCALIVHELMHCALKGFTTKGIPKWAIQGHDVEEHVAVVKYFGVGSAAGRTKELVEVARQKPLFGQAQINGACGTEGCRLAA